MASSSSPAPDDVGGTGGRCSRKAERREVAMGEGGAPSSASSSPAARRVRRRSLPPTLRALPCLHLDPIMHTFGHEAGGRGPERIVLTPVAPKGVSASAPAPASAGGARDHVVLGRNASTMIVDTLVSRELLTIGIDPGPGSPREGKQQQEEEDEKEKEETTPLLPTVVKLTMLKARGLHAVYLNKRPVDLGLGQMQVLNDGDVIGLMRDKYCYEVRVKEPELVEILSESDGDGGDSKGGTAKCAAVAPAATEASMASSSSSSSSSSPPPSSSLSDLPAAAKSPAGPAPLPPQPSSPGEAAGPEASTDQIVDGLSCSLCLGVLVKATTANPCGHTFCEACARQQRLGGSAMDAGRRRTPEGSRSMGSRKPSSSMSSSSSAAPTSSSPPYHEIFSTARQDLVTSPAMVPPAPNSEPAVARPAPACPECRQAVSSTTRNHKLDNLAWTLLLRGIFDPGDTRDYLDRSGRTLTDGQRKFLFPNGECARFGSTTATVTTTKDGGRPAKEVFAVTSDGAPFNAEGTSRRGKDGDVERLQLEDLNNVDDDCGDDGVVYVPDAVDHRSSSPICID